LIFLDIAIPEADGFDLLDCFKEHPFDVVFVTAYNQFALKAFKFHAMDFLLKPVMIDDIKKVIKNVKRRKE